MGSAADVPDADDWFGFWIGLGSEGGRHLEVTHLAPSGIADEGWHRFLVEASAPGFTARFQCETTLGVFAAFRDEVLAMHKTLQGAASLEFLEEGVHVHGEMIDRYGHVLWRIVLTHPIGLGSSELAFEISEDQTTLWNVVAKIDSLLEALGFSVDSR